MSMRAQGDAAKLKELATGEWIGSWSLTEPEAGSDAAGTRTQAVRQGEPVSASQHSGRRRSWAA